MVREGWRNLGGKRKSTGVTLAMKNTISAKVCGAHCQKGSTITGKGGGLYLMFKIREVGVSSDRS